MLQILLPTFAIKRISTAICSGIENSKRRTLGTRAPASRKFFRQPTSILRLLYDPCVCVCFSLRWLILKISITLRDYWFYGFSFLFFLTNQIRIYDRDDIFFPLSSLSINDKSLSKRNIAAKKYRGEKKTQAKTPIALFWLVRDNTGEVKMASLLFRYVTSSRSHDFRDEYD